MKITYIANHGNGGNDEEGAIAFALAKLGQKVVLVHERDVETYTAEPTDLLLFHHWRMGGALKKWDAPKAFWCFDLIDYRDETMKARSDRRKYWATQATRLCDLGFMTDGDWVDANRSGKLYWLPQAADERMMGIGSPVVKDIPILFTGSTNGGVRRESFIRDMHQVYGKDFVHIERGVHGAVLRDLIARSKIVVAPDGPVTDRYWSNRIYLTLGFGGFLLHPACTGLLGQFDCALPTYIDRGDLGRKIDHFLKEDSTRDYLADQCYRCVVADHTYSSRCTELLRVIKEKLGVG